MATINLLPWRDQYRQDKKNEYLLVSAEDYEGERTIELMAGVDIETATLNVI